MLVFQEYKKSYGKQDIISIGNLALESGIYWLRGENGTGKSTLMKSIAGLIPFKGNITVAGLNIRKQRREYTAVVNYAEAEPLLPGFLTGNDLISFYADAKNAPEGQVEHLCELLGVSNFAGNRIATYSSGMAKKLSLVLGFIGNPRLVLLDEPLITLDTASVEVLQRLINEYAQRGISFIVSSHQDVHPGSLVMKHLYIRNKTVEPE